MVLNKTLLIIAIHISILSCNSQDCQNIPSHFSTYEQAISYIKKATFKIKEVVNTTKSSWIRSASFYSCDGSSGYFIYKTDSKEYIHAGVPVTLWYGFKNASSFGSYYDKNIRGRYRFNL